MSDVQQQSNADKRQNAGVQIGFGLAVIATIIILVTIPCLPGNWSVHLLCFVFGGAAGWAAGFLLSPRDQKEDLKFSRVGAALVSLTTGFVAARVDQLFQKQIESGGLSSELAAAIGVVAATFLVGALSTFVWRSYAFH